ncbi:MAG: catechol 2,3-dioxygenase [Solirubrobacteraceae bacterium]|jgi:catechol 2,3-dioxygenase|nr:catechol 2,3-dioxygenase [Solirubrobacteraceae bacterium]
MADPAVRMSRVQLRVEDVPRAAGWYERVVGLEPRDVSDEAGELVSPGRGEVLVALRRSSAPGPSPRQAAGLFHTAFLYPRRPQLGAALRRVAESREPLSGASDHLASEALYLDDPDALGIELYADRPRETWPRDESGRYVLDTLPLDLQDLVSAGEPEGGESDDVEVGHVHLKVADLDASVRFWRGVGMDLSATLPRAGFLSTGGYHHHIGVNTWFSEGRPLEPADGPGLDAVVAAVAGDPGLEEARARLEAAGAVVESANGSLVTRTPDGVRVVLEPDARA